MAYSIKAVAEATVNKLQDIIGTDAGGRGMKALICPGDLVEACRILASLDATSHDEDDDSVVLVLSGFPCCVDDDPPTETDGPPGAVALARAAVQLGHAVRLVTDECNAAVFRAAVEDLFWNDDSDDDDDSGAERQQEQQMLRLEIVSATRDEGERLRALAKRAKLVLALERAGPGEDGCCRTMRGTNMNECGLIAPLHLLCEHAAAGAKFLAVGDGGNELGMGKVLDAIKASIPSGDRIGCVIAADHLVAASVSNWGGYAVAAGTAVVKASMEAESAEEFKERVAFWIEKCLPTEQEEIDLLNRCVAKGCRDGVSGKVEATVDGMPLETSLQCLRDLRNAALSLGE